MGKIVKNGVTYSGSSDNADNVKYNNNVSNLDATNVQEAIDKLDESVDTLNSKVKTLSEPGMFGCFGVFSNNAWGACNAIIWLPHTDNIKLSLVKVTTIGDGNISKDVTASCSISKESRLQYFIVSCTDTSVAGKLVSVEFNMTT